MEEETPKFLGKHIPLKEESVVPELLSEPRIDHSGDYDKAYITVRKDKWHNVLEALRKIASCKSIVPGDVVDIAQKALKEIK